MCNPCLVLQQPVHGKAVYKQGKDTLPVQELGFLRYAYEYLMFLCHIFLTDVSGLKSF